jgi:FkbH-like protein
MLYPESINDLNGWLIITEETLFMGEVIKYYLLDLGIQLVDPDQYEIKKRRDLGYEAIHINFVIAGIGSCEVMIMTQNDFYLYTYGQRKSLRGVGKLSKPHWAYKLERSLGNINPKQVFDQEDLLLEGDFASNCLDSCKALDGKIEVMVLSKTFRGRIKLTVVELPEGSYPVELALHPDFRLPGISSYYGFQLVKFIQGRRGKLEFMTVNKHIGEDRPLSRGMILMFDNNNFRSRFSPIATSSLKSLRAKTLLNRGSLWGIQRASSDSNVSGDIRNATTAIKKAKYDLVNKFLKFYGLLSLEESYQAIESGFLGAEEVVRYFSGNQRIDLEIHCLSSRGGEMVHAIWGFLQTKGFQIRGGIFNEDFHNKEKLVIQFKDVLCAAHITDSEISLMLSEPGLERYGDISAVEINKTNETGVSSSAISQAQADIYFSNDDRLPGVTQRIMIGDLNFMAFKAIRLEEIAYKGSLINKGYLIDKLICNSSLPLSGEYYFLELDGKPMSIMKISKLDLMSFDIVKMYDAELFDIINGIISGEASMYGGVSNSFLYFELCENTYLDRRKQVLANRLNAQIAYFGNYESGLKGYLDIYRPWHKGLIKLIPNFIDDYTRGVSVFFVPAYLRSSSPIVSEKAHSSRAFLRRVMHLGSISAQEAQTGKYGSIRIGASYVPVNFDLNSFKAIADNFRSLKHNDKIETKRSLLTQVFNICDLCMDKAENMVRQLDAYCGLNLYETISGSIQVNKMVFRGALPVGKEEDPFIKFFGIMRKSLKRDVTDPFVQRKLNEIMEIQQFTSWLLMHISVIMQGNSMGILEGGIDLSILVAEYAQELNFLSFEEDFFLSFNTDAGSGIRILTVPQMWFLILNELMKNSWGGMKGGFPRIEFLFTVKDGKLVFEYSDNGSGMSRTVAERSALIGFSTCDSNPSTMNGWGLGIPKIASLVKFFNGDIFIESEINKGVKVTVNLPLSFSLSGRKASSPIALNLHNAILGFSFLPGEKVSIIIQVKQTDGSIRGELVSIPAGMLRKMNKSIIEYAAWLIEASILGAQEISIMFEGLDDPFMRKCIFNGIKLLIESSKRKTRTHANYGQPIYWYMDEPLVGEEVLITENNKTVDYNKGKSIGVDIGADSFQVVVLSSGQIIFAKETSLSDIGDKAIGIAIEEGVTEAASRCGIKLEKLDICCAVPGLVNPEGKIVDLTNLEVRKPGSIQSLREFQERMSWGRTKVFFENEADVAAEYHAFIGGCQHGLVIAFSLGEGLGFSILRDGKFMPGPKEAHMRVDYSHDAPLCACGIKGCAEVMSNSSFVSRYALILAKERGIELPKTGNKLTAADVGAMFKSKNEVLRELARDVFIQVGMNLAPICAEVSRLLRESTFKVILTGSIACQWNIIKEGFEEAIKSKYPELNMEVIPVVVSERTSVNTHFSKAANSWHGSVGACLLGLRSQNERKLRVSQISGTKMNMLDNTYSVTIEAASRYSRIGKMLDIFEVIKSKGVRINGLSKQISSSKRVWTIDISGINKLEDVNDIANALRCIPDTNKKVLNTKPWILEFEVNHDSDKETVIRELTRHKIKIKHFFSPRFSKKTGREQVFFEVRVPKQLNIAKVKGILNGITSGGLIRFIPGKMIDEIAASFRNDLEKLGVDFTKQEWKLVKRILDIIARRHLSQVRKDRKNPYISHHIGGVEIQIGAGIRDKKAIFVLLLHDTVEDGDLTLEQIRLYFSKLLAGAVMLLTRKGEKTFMREKRYLSRIAEYLLSGNKTKIEKAVYAISAKLPDRIHSLRNIEYNDEEFQCRIYFSTLDRFMDFAGQIENNLGIIGNDELRLGIGSLLGSLRLAVVDVGERLGFVQDGIINKDKLDIYLGSSRDVKGLPVANRGMYDLQYYQGVLDEIKIRLTQENSNQTSSPLSAPDMFSDDEPRSKFYSENIYRMVLELIRLYSQRSGIREGIICDVREDVAGKLLSLAQEIEVFSTGIADPAYRLNITAGVNLRNKAREKLKEAVVFIRKNNEPAACALMVSAASDLNIERVSLVKERMSRTRRTRKIGFDKKENGIFVVQGYQQRYKISPSESTIFRGSKTIHPDTSLDAFRAGWHQIERETDELWRFREMYKKISEIYSSIGTQISGLSASEKSRGLQPHITGDDISPVQVILKDMSDSLDKVILENKKLLRYSLETAVALNHLGLFRQAYMVLGVSRDLIILRGSELSYIIENTFNGLLIQVIGYSVKLNSGAISRLGRIKKDIENQDLTFAYKKLQGLLKNSELRGYLDEPQFKGILGMRQLLGYAGSLLLNRENADGAMVRIRLVAGRLEYSQLVNSFMRQAIERYVNKNLTMKIKVCMDQIFRDVFLEFISRRGLNKGSPQADILWSMACQFTISPSIDNPETIFKGEQIANPIFKALSILIDIKTFDFTSLAAAKGIRKNVAFLLKHFIEEGKDNYPKINSGDRGSLFETLSAGLTVQDKAVFRTSASLFAGVSSSPLSAEDASFVSGKTINLHIDTGKETVWHYSKGISIFKAPVIFKDPLHQEAIDIVFGSRVPGSYTFVGCRYGKGPSGALGIYKTTYRNIDALWKMPLVQGNDLLSCMLGGFIKGNYCLREILAIYPDFMTSALATMALDAFLSYDKENDRMEFFREQKVSLEVIPVSVKLISFKGEKNESPVFIIRFPVLKTDGSSSPVKVGADAIDIQGLLRNPGFNNLFFYSLEQEGLLVPAYRRQYCLIASNILGKFISSRFGMPRFSLRGLYLEVVFGLRYWDEDYAATHYWLAITEPGGRRILRIDGSYDQFDPDYKGLIVADDYDSSLSGHQLLEINTVFFYQAQQYFREEYSSSGDMNKLILLSKQLSDETGFDFNDSSEEEICLIRLYHYYLISEHLRRGNWPVLDPIAGYGSKKILDMLMTSQAKSYFSASSPIPMKLPTGMPLTNIKVLYSRFGKRGFGTIFWLRDLIWLFGKKLFPGLSMNEAAFKNLYPVTVAWWLEGAVAYALSCVLGGNLFTAWGIFISGHILDLAFNIFRTKASRAPLINSIIALIIASLSIVAGWITVNPLSWVVHGAINLIFYLFSRYSPFAWRGRIISISTVILIFISMGIVNNSLNYFRLDDESKAIARNYTFPSLIQEQRDREAANRERIANSSWQSELDKTVNLLGRGSLSAKDALVEAQYLLDLANACIDTSAYRSLEEVSQILDFISNPEVANIASFSVRETVYRAKVRLLINSRVVFAGHEIYAVKRLRVLADNYRENVSLPDSLFPFHCTESEMLTGLLKKRLENACSLLLTTGTIQPFSDEEFPGYDGINLIQGLYYENTIPYDNFSLREAKSGLIEAALEDSVHAMPVALLRPIRKLRQAPVGLIAQLKDATEAFQISWEFAASHLINADDVRYSLYDLVKYYRVRNSGNEGEKSGYGPKNISLPRHINDALGGIFPGGGKNSMGAFQLRAYEVRRYNLLGRLGIDAAKLSDRQINMLMLNPRYAAEAWVALTRAVIDEVEDVCTFDQRGINDIVKEWNKSATVGHPFIRAYSREFFASIPAREDLGKHEWFITLYHPLFNGKMASPLASQYTVIVSGIGDNKPGVFTDVQTVKDLLSLQPLLSDKDEYLRKAARRTFEEIAQDSTNILQDEARKIISREHKSSSPLSRGDFIKAFSLMLLGLSFGGVVYAAGAGANERLFRSSRQKKIYRAYLSRDFFKKSYLGDDYDFDRLRSWRLRQEELYSAYFAISDLRRKSGNGDFSWFFPENSPGIYFERSYKPGTDHEAYDIFTDEGSPIMAFCAGVVVTAIDGWRCKRGEWVEGTGAGERSGNAVLIYNPVLESYSYYAHLSRIDVAAGDIVYPSGHIGLVGKTGINAMRTLPHLHFEYKVARGNELIPLRFREIPDASGVVIPSIEASSPLNNYAQDLIKNKKLVITADNGKSFSFLYEDKHFHKFRIVVFDETAGIKVGFIDVRGNEIDSAFDASDIYPAIEVLHGYNQRYRGIGSALMLLSMSIAEYNGYFNFRVLHGRNAGGFYHALDFVPSGHDNSIFVHSLGEELPQINIEFKDGGLISSSPLFNLWKNTPIKFRVGVFVSGGDCALNPFVGYLVQYLMPRGYLVAGIKNGLDGLVKEDPSRDIIPVTAEMAAQMPYWPSFEFGSTRRSLVENTPEAETALKNIRENFGFVIGIGGNDHLYEAKKLGDMLNKRGIDCLVIGAPKTIDGDTLFTMPLGAESASQALLEYVYRAAVLPGSGKVVILEAMGRDCGRLAALAGNKKASEVIKLLPAELQHRIELVGPTLETYVPEHPISINVIRSRVAERMQKVGGATIICSEGLRLNKEETVELTHANPTLKEIMDGMKTDTHGNFVIPQGISAEFLAEALKDYHPTLEIFGFTPRGAMPTDEERRISKAFADLAGQAIEKSLKEMAVSYCDDLRYPGSFGKIELVSINQVCGKNEQGKSLSKNLDNMFTKEDLQSMGVVIDGNEPINESLAAGLTTDRRTKDAETLSKAFIATSISAWAHRRPSVFYVGGDNADTFLDNISGILRNSQIPGVIYGFERSCDSMVVLSGSSYTSLRDALVLSYGRNAAASHLNVLVSENFKISKDDPLILLLRKRREMIGEEYQQLKSSQDTDIKRLDALKKMSASLNELFMRLEAASQTDSQYFEFDKNTKSLGQVIKLILLTAPAPEAATTYKQLSDVRLTSLDRSLDKDIYFYPQGKTLYSSPVGAVVAGYSSSSPLGDGPMVEWELGMDALTPVDETSIPGFKQWIVWNGPAGHFLFGNDDASFDWAVYLNGEGNVVFGLPSQTKIRAVADGVVVQVYRHSGPYGCFINIEHGKKFSGIFSSYIHVVPFVEYGQEVKKGQEIATLYKDLSGGEGRLIHLHFSVTNGWKSKNRLLVDPEKGVYAGVNFLHALPERGRSFRIVELSDVPPVITANFDHSNFPGDYKDHFCDFIEAIKKNDDNGVIEKGKVILNAPYLCITREERQQLYVALKSVGAVVAGYGSSSPIKVRAMIKRISMYLGRENKPSGNLDIFVGRESLSWEDYREAIKNGLSIIRKKQWYGRTALLPLGDGNILAVKFLKVGEKRLEIHEEAVMMQELRKKGLNIPIPLKTCTGEFTVDYAGLLKTLAKEADPSMCYISYIAPSSYFVYPKDIMSKEAMVLCAKRSMDEFAWLLKHGYIHTSLSTLTHEKVSGRTWSWVYRPIGGLEELHKLTAWPNIRLTGLADFAHVRKLFADDYLRNLVGQGLAEWAITMAYCCNRNGFRRKDILKIIINGFAVFLDSFGLSTDGMQEMKYLEKFISLLKREKRTDWSSEADGDIPTMDNLICFVESLLVKLTTGSPSYQHIVNGTLQVWELSRNEDDIFKKGGDDPRYIFTRSNGALYEKNRDTGDLNKLSEKFFVDPIAFLTEGNSLFVADCYTKCLVEINRLNGELKLLSKGVIGNPRALLHLGPYMYVADYYKKSILEINLVSGKSKELAKGAIVAPKKIAYKNGTFYVFDVVKKCIIGISIPQDNGIAPLSDVSSSPVSGRRPGSKARFLSLGDVLWQLFWRTRNGLGNTKKDLLNGSFPDEALYYAARRYKVCLPGHDPYPGRHSVLEELERRRRLGWPSSDRDLRSHPDKKLRDAALIKAAKEFGVPLPSGEKDRVLDDKLARFGFSKKSLAVSYSLVGRVLIRREYAHSMKLVDLNKAENYLKIEASGEMLKLSLPVFRGRPAFEEDIDLRGYVSSVDLSDQPLLTEFLIRVFWSAYPGDNLTTAVMKELRSGGIKYEKLSNRVLVWGDLYIRLPRFYIEEPGVVALYRELLRGGNLAGIEQRDNPDNFIILLNNKGNIHILMDNVFENVPVPAGGNNVYLLKTDVFKRFDLKILRPLTAKIKGGSHAASLGQAAIAFSSANNYLIRRKAGAIYRKEEREQYVIEIIDQDTEEVVTCIRRIGEDIFEIDGFSLPVKTDYLNLSTIVNKFPDFATSELRARFASTDEESFGGAERIVQYEIGDGILIRKDYSGMSSSSPIRESTFYPLKKLKVFSYPATLPVSNEPNRKANTGELNAVLAAFSDKDTLTAESIVSDNNVIISPSLSAPAEVRDYILFVNPNILCGPPEQLKVIFEGHELAHLKGLGEKEAEEYTLVYLKKYNFLTKHLAFLKSNNLELSAKQKWLDTLAQEVLNSQGVMIGDKTLSKQLIDKIDDTLAANIHYEEEEQYRYTWLEAFCPPGIQLKNSIYKTLVLLNVTDDEVERIVDDLYDLILTIRFNPQGTRRNGASDYNLVMALAQIAQTINDPDLFCDVLLIEKTFYQAMLVEGTREYKYIETCREMGWDYPMHFCPKEIRMPVFYLYNGLFERGKELKCFIRAIANNIKNNNFADIRLANETELQKWLLSQKNIIARISKPEEGISNLRGESSVDLDVIQVSRDNVNLSIMKCLVLDCDGVLWSGIVGEYGLDGIYITWQYRKFQEAVKSLQERGIILAINSKNNLENVLKVLEDHQDMVLRKSDFVVIKANWQDKSINLREIAGELNIGLDSIVFLDDNIRERQLVKEFCPGVLVPELSEDATERIRLIDGLRLLGPKNTTQEDAVRTQLYKAKKERDALRTKAKSLEDYYDSLSMELMINRGWENKYYTRRIAQLTQRTSQFNLTGRKYEEEEVSALLEDDKYLVLSLRFSDKFGDAGIVGVAISHRTTDLEWEIDSFCLSCRVFGFGVERALISDLLSSLYNISGTQERVIGKYVPTGRNNFSENFFELVGFNKLGYNDGVFKYFVDKETSKRILWHVNHNEWSFEASLSYGKCSKWKRKSTKELDCSYYYKKFKVSELKDDLSDAQAIDLSEMQSFADEVEKTGLIKVVRHDYRKLTMEGLTALDDSHVWRLEGEVFVESLNIAMKRPALVVKETYSDYCDDAGIFLGEGIEQYVLLDDGYRVYIESSSRDQSSSSPINTFSELSVNYWVVLFILSADSSLTVLGYLKSVLNSPLEMPYYPDHSCSGVVKLKQPARYERYLSPTATFDQTIFIQTGVASSPVNPLHGEFENMGIKLPGRAVFVGTNSPGHLSTVEKAIISYGMDVTVFDPDIRGKLGRKWERYIARSGQKITFVPEGFENSAYPSAGCNVAVLMSVLSAFDIPLEIRERMLFKAMQIVSPGGYLMIGWYQIATFFITELEERRRVRDLLRAFFRDYSVWRDYEIADGHLADFSFSHKLMVLRRSGPVSSINMNSASSPLAGDPFIGFKKMKRLNEYVKTQNAELLHGSTRPLKKLAIVLGIVDAVLAFIKWPGFIALGGALLDKWDKIDFAGLEKLADWKTILNVAIGVAVARMAPIFLFRLRYPKVRFPKWRSFIAPLLVPAPFGGIWLISRILNPSYAKNAARPLKALVDTEFVLEGMYKSDKFPLGAKNINPQDFPVLAREILDYSILLFPNDYYRLVKRERYIVWWLEVQGRIGP